MLRMLLIKMVFSVWAPLAAHSSVEAALQKTPEARQIAEAAVDAVIEDARRGLPPIGATYYHDLAVQAYWAKRESELRAHAVGDGGKSHGPWQLQGACGHRPLPEQARCWRALVREGQKLCPDAPYAILWGGCNIDLKGNGLPGWTTRTASLQRVRKSDALLATALQSMDENE